MTIFDDSGKDKDNQAGEVKAIKNEDGSYTVGDKHYKDEETLLQSRIHADKHIDTLQQELKALREQAKQTEATKGVMEKLLSEITVLKAGGGGGRGNQDDNQDDPNDAGKRNQQPQDIDKLIDQKVQERLQSVNDKMTEAERKSKFKEALIDEFGSKDAAKAALDKYSQLEGFDEDIFAISWAKNPNGMAKQIKQVVGGNNRSPQERATQHPRKGYAPTNNRNTDQLNNVNKGKTFADYYKKMLQNPNLWSKEDNAAMIEAYDADPQGFMAGLDFNSGQRRVLKFEK